MEILLNENEKIFVRTNQKIQAIKAVRERYDRMNPPIFLGLKEAKDAVDQWAFDNGLSNYNPIANSEAAKKSELPLYLVRDKIQTQLRNEEKQLKLLQKRVTLARATLKGLEELF
jgi:hypothetical protein